MIGEGRIIPRGTKKKCGYSRWWWQYQSHSMVKRINITKEKNRMKDNDIIRVHDSKNIKRELLHYLL